jgi:GTP pyrophosphokinase
VKDNVFFFQIVDKVLDYYPEANTRILEKAYVFAARTLSSLFKHRHAQSLNGNRYGFLTHNLSVASILSDLKLDEETIAAGILHDVGEKLSPEANISSLLSPYFSEDIARIVDGVTRLNKLSYSQKKTSKDKEEKDDRAEYFRKMLLAISRDVRVIFVKLADRLDEIRRVVAELDESSADKDPRTLSMIDLARETLDVYAPLAARLGIEWIKKDLENLAFRILDPEAYNNIVQKLATTEEDRNRYIEEVKQILYNILYQHGIQAQVLGRPKHIYSIHKKMLTQQIDINRIYDLIAFRIIVDTIDDCYRVLSIVQSHWEPIPGRYKNFIQRPKPNGYQSIHITVVGPHGEPMEIQIRTKEMDQIANNGIAAHRLYKEGQTDGASIAEQGCYLTLRNILESKNTPEHLKKAFRELMDKELFPNEVYVLTPGGDIKVLPRGSTPIDFAYSIHTELGHRCIGARVNGKIVPLRYELQNGDVVEILTSKKQRPSRDWLNFVKTSKARNRIKQWLKVEEYEKAVAEGRELCEREFRKKGVSFSDYVNSPKLVEVAHSFSLSSIDDLMANVGFRKITPLQIFGRLLPELRDKVVRDEEVQPEETLITKKEHSSQEDRLPKSIVKILGSGDVLTHFAKCCNPLPGEPIVGYITRGRGVTIHRKDCRNVKQAEKERLIDVEWDPLLWKYKPGSGKTVSENTQHVVPIRVVFSNKKGAISAINSVLDTLDAEIVDIRLKLLPDGVHEGRLRVGVKDIEHLKKVLMALKSEETIYEVQRLS